MLLSSEMAAKTDILGARIKQAGHLIDRPWTITSQVNSLYEGGLWAEIATNANAMGERLRKSFKDMIHKEDHLVQEVYGSTNMTFAQLSNLHYCSAAEIFEHAPEKAYIWENHGHYGCTVRFVTSHSTDVSIIDKLISKVDHESAGQFFAATMGGHPT
jgi:threonine aldolase